MVIDDEEIISLVFLFLILFSLFTSNSFSFSLSFSSSSSSSDDSESCSTSSNSKFANSKFISDGNIPDNSVTQPKQLLLKSWIVKNTGKKSWLPGTKLIFTRGDEFLLTQDEFDVPIAKKGETVEVSALIKTPNECGNYSAYFSLADKHRNPFGERLWIKISVVANDVDSDHD
ncbi:unnamed protein product, partial [marine sediment metagenome]